MSDGYNIPLGIDLGDGLKKFDDLISRAEALQKSVKETGEATAAANKEIASGAEKAAIAIQEEAKAAVTAKRAAEERAKAEKVAISVMDELSKRQSENIQLNERQTKIVADYVKGLEFARKALATATDPTHVRAISNEMERLRDKIVKHYDDAAKAIRPVNAALQDTGSKIDQLSDAIAGTFSDVDMENLSNAINSVNTETEQLGVLIDFISEKMEGMDTSSELFQDLTKEIEQANMMLGRNAEAVDISTLSWDQLTDRLKYFQDSLKGETNPQEIIRINQEIENTQAQLKRVQSAGKEGFDELGNKIIPEAAEKVKSLNTELEETVQQLAKMQLEGNVDTASYDALLQRATEIKQAISNVNDELKITSSETRGLDTLIESASLVTAGFNLAQGSMALFGAESEELEKVTAKLAGGIAVLQGLQEIQVQLKNRESVANKALTATQALYTTVVGTSTGALKAFRIALAATGVGLIVLAIGALVANWDKLKKIVLDSIPGLEKVGEIFTKIKNAVTDFIGVTSEATRALDRLKIANEAMASSVESQIAILQARGGKEKEIYEASIGLIQAQRKELLETAKVNGELTKEESQRLVDLNTQQNVLFSAEQKRLEEASKKREEDAKKAATAAKKVSDDAEKERKKEIERIKEFNRQLVDLESQRQALVVSNMTDSVEKEKAQEELRYQGQLQALARELEDFKGSQEEKTKLQAAQQRIREQLLDEHISKLAGIDVKYFNDMVKNQQESEKMILEINKQSKELELLELDNKFKEIADKYKEANGVEIDLTEQKQRAIDEVNTRYDLEGIDKSEEIALARIDQMKIEGRDEEEIARLREAMKLSILIDGASARLELLEKLGGEENKVEIENLQAFIAQANREITSINKSSSKNLFQILGLDVTKEESKMITDAWGNVFSQITDLWGQAISNQIALKQQQIDMLNQQVSETERALDREIRLQEQGYANNVDAKKKELEELQAQRDADIQARQELQKKEQQMAIIQVAINGIVQTSEMALAAAKIFSAHAGIPFAGVAIAAAAGLAMVATFLSIRNQIKAMQSDVPTFRDGGEFLLDGPSHERGGLGVYNERTGKRVAEVEGGEGFFATNKRSTKKYRPLLEAINDDDFGRVSRFVDSLLEDTGVRRPVYEQTDKVVILAHKKQDREERYKEAMLAFAESESLKDIADSNRRMLEIERRRKIITDTQDHRIEQQGNIIRRIKKKKD